MAFSTRLRADCALSPHRHQSSRSMPCDRGGKCVRRVSRVGPRIPSTVEAFSKLIPASRPRGGGGSYVVPLGARNGPSQPLVRHGKAKQATLRIGNGEKVAESLGCHRKTLATPGSLEGGNTWRAILRGEVISSLHWGTAFDHPARSNPWRTRIGSFSCRRPRSEDF